MALNPILFTEKVVSDFLKYQLTTYPLADPNLHEQMRALLSLDETRATPLLKGPYISLSRGFLEGARVGELVAEGILHPHMQNIVPFETLHAHQERAVRTIHEDKSVLVSTGTGSGKTECFIYPIISRCLDLRDQGAPEGIVAVIVYPMNALAEDQLGRLRELLTGSGVTFGMYIGKTPENAGDVTGRRLQAGASQAAYLAAVKKAEELEQNIAIHPPEERPSRQELRDNPPRILLTNVKQLELLLTRRRDIQMYDSTNLEFLVFDEAHTAGGVAGAETACLIRRLRSFCGRKPDEVVCVATSATLIDPERGPDAAKDFAIRFFGVDRDRIDLVGEKYAPDLWGTKRSVPKTPPGEIAAHLKAVLGAVTPEADSAIVSGQKVASAYEAMTGQHLDATRWAEGLYEQLGANELVYQMADLLQAPKLLRNLLAELEERVGRPVAEEELLAWLALGAASKKEDRPLLRPVIHAFIGGVGGAVVTFPDEQTQPRLWLAAEQATPEGDGEEASYVRLPLMTCTTCGQHYFSHHVADFSFFENEPAGGQAIEDRWFWPPLDRELDGRRVVLFDRLLSAIDEEGEEELPRATAEVFLCRYCGALHPAQTGRCDGCGREAPLVRLLAVKQKEDRPGKLTKCLSCGAPGRQRPGTYREPARPVRAVTVSDVHVLAQNMMQASERRRLLVFADNRQDAAFQAGWMRDHARRYRLRALMMERIKESHVSVGDLTAYLDSVLEADDNLSRALIPEVWQAYRKESAGTEHRNQRHYFLRIAVLRELTTGVKQRLGLEPWGRLKIEYQGLTPDLDFIKHWAARLGVDAERLCDGITALLDTVRRGMILLDREGNVFSKFWMEGDREISLGYLPSLPGVPKALKLSRAPSDDANRLSQWLSERGDSGARQAARAWGVAPEEIPAFLTDLWALLADQLRLLVPVTLTGARGRALPNCAGAYQIDADRLLLGASHGVWRCSKCRRAQTRPTPNNACLAFRCTGTLKWHEEDPENYDLTVLDQDFVMLRPREHSAMVPDGDRERFERAFKSESEFINTLVCTPTLELGVDIGSLDSVMMRNVPPLPANYWQRVGRAGRRQRMAANITYARTNSHDQAYFHDPLKLLGGLIMPPRFNMRNEVMVRKHVHATVLSTLYKLSLDNSPLSQTDRDEISETLTDVFPPRINAYLFDAAGNVRSEVHDVSALAAIIAKHENLLIEQLKSVFSQNWPVADGFVVSGQAMARMLAEMTGDLEAVVKSLKRRLDWAMDQQARLAQIKQRRGTLEPDEAALERRCDRLISRLKGQERRQRREAEGYDDINTYAVLSVEGFLPGYGLEIGSVRATAQLPRRLGERDFDLPRTPAMALREYVPGNLIYANGKRFTPRFFHLAAEEAHVEPLAFQVDIGNEAVAEIGAGSGALGADTLKAIPICDVDLPHQSIISDEDEFRFQMSVAVWGYEQERHGPGKNFQWGDKGVTLRKGVHLRLVNVGPSFLLPEGRLGYPVCRVCGQSRSPLSSQTERQNFADDHRERCGREVENIGFYADVIADTLTIQACAGREEAYSVAEALRIGASRVLDMAPDDVQILALPRPGHAELDIAIYDPMPGGSGLLDQMCERWAEVTAAAREVAERCTSQCERSCIDCLQTFRNAHVHRYLDRKTALGCLASWGDALEFVNDIPANLPTGVEEMQGLPANEAEMLFGEMLRRAGFPEPIRNHQILLGRPLGSTTPDAFYRGEDAGDPGTCIFLDGLSSRLHGDPARSEQDRRIRDQLRAMHYEVFEIPASHLFDQGAMAQHFYRLARVLLDKEQAKAIRDTEDWYIAQPAAEGVAQPIPAEPGAAARPRELATVPREEAKPYETHVPVYSLEAAAGKFGRDMSVEEEGWISVDGHKKLTEDMFAAHISGKSMEPRIPDGSLCLFKANPQGSRQGKLVLVWHRGATDPALGGEYSVKKYESKKIQAEDDSWQHEEITLHPLNPDPAYQPLQFKPDEGDDIRVIAEFIEVLK